jgi:hypothetical protein
MSASVGKATSEKNYPAGSNPAGQDHMSFRFPPEKGTKYYFNELFIVVNWALRLVPSPFTAAMIASAMPAAIKPYSIAVAPD